MTSIDVLQHLADLCLEHGAPDYIRSDNGPEFTAELIRTWLERIGVGTLFIEPGSPWENGYVCPQVPRHPAATALALT